MGRRKTVHVEEGPEISRSIIAILLFAFGAIIILSFFDKAGLWGQMLNEYLLSALFGRTKFVSPFIFFAVGWMLIADRQYSYRRTHAVGAGLLLISIASLLHMMFPAGDMWREALEGHGGGLFGMPAWILQSYLGTIAGVLLLLALILISILLVFNTAITHFVLVNQRLMESFGSFGRGLTATVETLFVKKESGESSDDLLDDEDDDVEEEEEPVFVAKRVGEKVAPEEEEEEEDDAPEEEEKEEAADTSYMAHVIIKNIPPLDLLSSKRGKPTSGDIDANRATIKSTFADFHIDVEMGETRVGPTVTQFTMKPAKGVKISKMTSLSNNIALALAAHPIRIEAPIPGTSLVGIEVPNEIAAQVTLKELLENKEFTGRKHNLMIALGKDVSGKVWFADLPKMPHLLVAGATGSGKTVCINTILMSLLYQNTAETLRLILVDPKRVELTSYNGIPHLLTPVITNVQKTINALKWTIGEMDRRFEVLSQAGNRDIWTYNEGHPKERLPHIVFVIDELADLMQSASNEIEGGIIRLAQMARAVGIHLILATQRPSVDVITGLMKANIPGRIAFSVASLIDSRTILDAPGAEKLLGRGDMLLSTAELGKPIRIQGAFISEQEVSRVIEYLKGDEEPVYDASIVDRPSGAIVGTANMFGGPGDGQDPLFDEAKAAIIEAGKASASLLQRRLRVGYARAARLLDELEEAGVIGPGDGSKPREILLAEKDVPATMGMGGELNVYGGPVKKRDVPEPAHAPTDVLALEEEEVEEDDDEMPDFLTTVDDDDTV